MPEFYHRRSGQSLWSVILQPIASLALSNFCHGIQAKTACAAPSLLRTFTAQFGSQRERVIGEFGGSFGGNCSESFPLISG
jgi:hypothetical protein